MEIENTPNTSKNIVRKSTPMLGCLAKKDQQSTASEEHFAKFAVERLLPHFRD
jgi:hypothetical protein